MPHPRTVKSKQVASNQPKKKGRSTTQILRSNPPVRSKAQTEATRADGKAEARKHRARRVDSANAKKSAAKRGQAGRTARERRKSRL